MLLIKIPSNILCLNSGESNSNMTSKTETQIFLDQRQEILTKKFEAGDVTEILKSYDEREVDFSDHAWGAANIDRNGLIAFLEETYTTVPGLKMITHGVHGTKEFSVWEWTLKFRATEDDKVRGLEKGKEMWLRGCSLHWWRIKKGGDPNVMIDWRICKEGDYACPTAVGKSE